jgi:dTDP-4-dehydrorhamnose reductase
MRYADVEAVRVCPSGIVGHHRHLISAWKRYRRPVAITEVHLACTREEQMRWLMESWRGALRARARGADVRAVTAWALLGSFDWDSLVTRDAGRYEPGIFDIRASPPRGTAVGDVVRSRACGARPQHPALAGVPWWRRSQRFLHGGLSKRVEAASNAPPVLIIGASGTLGRAFHRICEARGLSSHLAGRQEVDIGEPTAIDAVLRRVEPWAVINAAGYVRVDAAERDKDACRRSNVIGPVNLAAACRRRGIPLVTFSSDLVFDGSKDVCYVEKDEPRPLNVYGACKMEAERRVLDLLPDALVVRTSSFFGPWDEYNFLAAVFRALDAGAPVLAPEDTTVSPTYVPDLAHATLDLLIDGAYGLWHLANDGAITWFEFARGAAVRSGRNAERIQPVEAARVWGPAVRPRFTPLASDRAQLLRPLDAAVGAFLEDTQSARLATGTDA